MGIIIFAIEAVLLVAMLRAILMMKKEITFSKKAALDYVDNTNAEFAARFAQMSARIDALEKGLAPDYEKSKEAAKNLDAFNEAINAIWAYDPYKTLRKEDGDKD